MGNTKNGQTAGSWRKQGVRNTVTLDADGIIRLVYQGPQTRKTLRTITERLFLLMRQRREEGEKVCVLANMRGITNVDSSARLEAKWFLEEADFDALAVVGNAYLRPFVFFVLRDFKSKKSVRYFTTEKNASVWLLSGEYEAGVTHLKLHDTLKWLMLPLLVLVGSGIVISWFLAQGRVEAEAEKAFSTTVIKVEDAVESRLRLYTDTLYGFRGLFHSSDEVTEREYHEYFASLNLARHYPGFNSVNYVARVAQQEKAAFIAAIRADRSYRPEGNPAFSLLPDTAREEHFVVTYVGVSGVGSGQGVDLAANDERRRTLETARDTGGPRASGTVQLLNQQGQEQAGVRGFLVTIPVYRNDVPTSALARRVEHQGFVNAVFNYDMLFTQAFKNVLPDDATIVAYDAAGTKIYRQGPAIKGARTETISVNIAGQGWKIEVLAPQLYGVGRTDRAMPYAVVAAGIGLILFLAVVLWLQNRSRRRAIELASAMTEDIKHERNTAVATKNKDEAILSSIGDGVLVLNRQGIVTLLNGAAEKMCGFTATEVIGKPYKTVLTFLNEQDGTVVDAFIRTALSGKPAEMARYTMLKRKDGTMIPVADSAAPVVDGSGKVMGAVVVFRDITRERQLERMKDEFLSVASHELRTPMGAIRATISMMLSGDYGPVNKELIEPLTDMKTSAVRLVDLVNDLLNVARIEAGRMKFTLSDFDIYEIVRSTVASLAPLGKEKGIAITALPGKSVTVQADVDKIKQVLTNLMGNALKFTDAGSITVSVAAQKDTVEVIVADTGIGITPADQAKLFAKFEQITSAQSGKPQGTGLGLYISREMIRKQGGELRIKQSVFGKGSAFMFTLPQPGTPTAERVRKQIDREAQLHPDQK